MNHRFCILGTAGHIDHGKSALVLALTGTDPDRLPEERARGMTIELGFAHVSIPGEVDAAPLEVGIVDVPGHERFVRTMVAGATGVDLALLVVAADDGIMPQTREHIEILNLLGLDRGVIAISKCDVATADRRNEVRREIEETVKGGALQDWPIVETSARTGLGLGELRRRIREVALQSERRRTSEIFRLAIDRVFTIHGRGTVVTGSVLSGEIAPGALLELQPVGITCKVREIQSHGAVVENAGGGQRAALNLTGVEKDKIERGMELATPGYLTPSRYIDARVQLSTQIDSPFLSHQRVRVSIGTTEAMAMFVVIGAESIRPGESAFVQLRFLTPMIAAHGQRFILRNETAQRTIGGGAVVRPVSRRVRPLHRETVEAIERAGSEVSYTRFCEAIARAGFESVGDVRLACETGVEPSEIMALRDRMSVEGILISAGSRTLHRNTLVDLEHRALAYLKRHHTLKPGEPGVAKDRFVGWIAAKAVAGMGREVFSRLEQRGELVMRGPYAAHRAFQPAMSPEDAETMASIVKEIAAAGFDPPEWAKLKAVQSLSKQRSKAFEDLAKTSRDLVSFAPSLFISLSYCERFREAVRSLGSGGRRFKLADVRDKLGLTRRVVQPLLEHLDRTQFTKRIGDERVLAEQNDGSR